MATLSQMVQSFLQKRLQEGSMSRTEFSAASNIPYTTVCKMLTASHKDVELKTLISVAKYFSCSIDEILGRKDGKDTCATIGNIGDQKYDINNSANSLRCFIKDKLAENAISSYTLSKNCGCGDVTIHGFIKSDNTKNILSTAVVIAIADYFNVSIDEMLSYNPHKIKQDVILEAQNIISAVIADIKIDSATNIGTVSQKAVNTPDGVIRAVKATSRNDKTI